MRSVAFTLSTTLMLGLVFGCASASTTIIQPMQSLPKAISLSVDPEPGVSMSEEQKSRLRSILTTALRDGGVALVPAGNAQANGSVERYQPGIRALRYLVGFGAGRGRFESTWRVSDESGETIGQCEIEGGIAMGVFGGSFDSVLEKVGKELAEFLRGE